MKIEFFVGIIIFNQVNQARCDFQKIVIFFL
jgi:hypothetical protein